MTNESLDMTALINDCIIDYTSNRAAASNMRNYSNDAEIHPYHRFAFAFTRAASLDLAESLTYSRPHSPAFAPDSTFSDKYYFSDSTYDEITNPLAACADAESLIAILYECDLTEYPNIASTIADHLDNMLMLDLADDAPEIATMNDLIAYIESTYKIAPRN